MEKSPEQSEEEYKWSMTPWKTTYDNSVDKQKKTHLFLSMFVCRIITLIRDTICCAKITLHDSR